MTANIEEQSPPESDFSAELAERIRSAPTDERVYRTALELHEPTPVSEVAARADCSKNAARRHLKRLDEIGLLTCVMENPETFKRNESYFEWRRLNRLAELSDTEYKDRIGELLTENKEYQKTYSVEKPADINPLEYDAYGDPEQVWLDLNNWEAIQTEIQDLRQARQDETVGEGVA
jgi:predicted transcriptional regulator